jgi:hypothetical protein
MECGRGVFFMDITEDTVIYFCCEDNNVDYVFGLAMFADGCPYQEEFAIACRNLKRVLPLRC